MGNAVHYELGSACGIDVAGVQHVWFERAQAAELVVERVDRLGVGQRIGSGSADGPMPRGRQSSGHYPQRLYSSCDALRKV
jgi:hypothetical protein